MKALKFIFIQSFIIFSLECTSEKMLQNGCIDNSKSYSYKLTKSILTKIGKAYEADFNSLGYIEFPSTLLERKEFQSLIKDICAHKQNLFKIIILNEKKDLEKSISLYTVQFLCINDWLELAQKIEQSSLSSSYKIYLLKRIINQDMSSEIVKNYSNKKLIKYFNVIMNRYPDKELYDDMSYILSGEAEKDQEILSKNQQSVNRWSCGNIIN